MKDYKDLVARLRGTKSQSKRKMLDDAADAIEHLQRQLAHKQDVLQQQVKTIMELRSERDAAVATVKRLDLECAECAHNKEPASCMDSNVFCDFCEEDCICKDCQDNSRWEWKA